MTPFVLALGSNLGLRQQNLQKAQKHLQEVFTLVKASQIYESQAMYYEEQQAFLNQVIEFKTPKDIFETFALCQEIERDLKKKIMIPKGPRTIDIDFLFWGQDEISTPQLQIPHPRWQERAFVVFPLKELPFFKKYLGEKKLPDLSAQKISLFTPSS